MLNINYSRATEKKGTAVKNPFRGTKSLNYRYQKGSILSNFSFLYILALGFLVYLIRAINAGF